MFHSIETLQHRLKTRMTDEVVTCTIGAEIMSRVRNSTAVPKSKHRSTRAYG